MSTGRQIRLGLLVLTVVGLAVQFWFAGRGVFGASSFEAHKNLGHVFEGISLLILIASIATAELRNRVDIGMAALLLVLVVLQNPLADAGSADVKSFHPVNALLIVGLTFSLLARDLRARRATAAQR